MRSGTKMDGVTNFLVQCGVKPHEAMGWVNTLQNSPRTGSMNVGFESNSVVSLGRDAKTGNLTVNFFDPNMAGMKVQFDNGTPAGLEIANLGRSGSTTYNATDTVLSALAKAARATHVNTMQNRGEHVPGMLTGSFAKALDVQGVGPHERVNTVHPDGAMQGLGLVQERLAQVAGHKQNFTSGGMRNQQRAHAGPRM